MQIRSPAVERLALTAGLLLLLGTTHLLSVELAARQWFATDKLPLGKCDDALRTLMIARYNAATEELARQQLQYEAGVVTISQRNRTAVRVLQAALAINNVPAEQIRIREQYLKLLADYERHEL